MTIRDIPKRTETKFRKIAEKEDKKHRVLFTDMVQAYVEKSKKI